LQEGGADGEEALEILENDPEGFDLVLSDVVMPGLDGPGLLQAAKPYLGRARVVFMSGYAEQDFAKTLEDERSISFLPKPFTLAQLAERVKLELAAA
jgi:two-component system, cell cycle sensor histidine kinase and response regulator CckA